MIFDFGFGFGETYDVMFETYVGNALVSHQPTRANRPQIEAHFKGMIRQAMSQKSPTQVKVKRIEQVWCQFDQSLKCLEIELGFKNWNDLDMNTEGTT